ncbi:MAG: hypothetical protein HN380_31825 [Victivallales bacterium]|nr:hypothetical protein [Victivallales bacterium]
MTLDSFPATFATGDIAAAPLHEETHRPGIGGFHHTPCSTWPVGRDHCVVAAKGNGMGCMQEEPRQRDALLIIGDKHVDGRITDALSTRPETHLVSLSRATVNPHIQRLAGPA